MIFMEKPEDFQPRFEVVSIFCEYDERFILLHRNESKPQGNTWGVPAGKVDENENILEAIIRELHQETGILLDKNIIKYFKKVFVRYHKYDFIYHIFHAKLVSPVMLKINKNEHNESSWVTPKNALNMPLIQDLDVCIKLFYKIT
ncbi:MAG: NUDIX hydrolase [Candidatus Aenigmarchaeota archaeon]|nr:NUDIX hydrolase [Candidatus Aenigmarchaeota archaeon]